MIKEKVEEVGVHFSTRRSKRDKYLFVNRLAGKLQEAGRTLQIFQKNQESGEGRHLVSGKIGGGWIFAAAYDTGTKMLNPSGDAQCGNLFYLKPAGGGRSCVCQ